MVKSVKAIPWTNIALLVGAAFAWTKLGVGAAVKDVGVPTIFRREYPPLSEVGHLGQAQWQRIYGGSYLDYQDWLKGV